MLEGSLEDDEGTCMVGKFVWRIMENRGKVRVTLPHRYQAASAHVVDSRGVFSEQIDVVVFDRQYSPFIFQYEGQTIIPAESVYAVFEVKQVVNAAQVSYAQKKVSSVRGLHRTSLPIPYAQDTYPPKPLIPIIRDAFQHSLKFMTLRSDIPEACT